MLELNEQELAGEPPSIQTIQSALVLAKKRNMLPNRDSAYLIIEEARATASKNK